MSLALCFIFLAAGAVLRYAVEDNPWSGINEDVVGAILMVIGALGILLTILVLSTVKSATRLVRRERPVPTPKPIRRRPKS